MGIAKPVVPVGMCLFVALILSASISVCAESPEETTLDPVENRPVNFYVNKSGEAFIIKNVICNGFPCPMYSVEEDQSQLIQERLYAPMDVVVAPADCTKPFNEALTEGYMKLFSYRKGNNFENVNIPMSVPVIVYITEQPTGKKCTFEVWFYVNASSLANGAIPEPTDIALEIRKQIAGINVYVGTFRGVVNDPEPYLNATKNNLKSDSEYNKKEYFVVMYDAPWKTEGRRNEIWLKKETSSSS